jgi:outer membrane lipoprotein-sorting protein
MRSTMKMSTHQGLSAALRRGLGGLGLLAVLTSWTAAAQPAKGATPSAEELLKEADRARGGLNSGITWTTTIDTTEDGQKSTRSALVKARQNDALVEMTAPAREKGQIILFNDRNLWFFKPGLKKPVSISSRQKLSGQAANGDIASTNYSRDYKGTVVGEEKVNGEDTYRLELKAQAKNVTYDQIRYWVSKSNKLAVKAEFLTLQGKVFKVATFEYGNTLKAGSQQFPFVSKMTITDAAFPDNSTTIAYGVPKVEEHPTSIFNINNVVR